MLYLMLICFVVVSLYPCILEHWIFAMTGADLFEGHALYELSSEDNIFGPDLWFLVNELASIDFDCFVAGCSFLFWIFPEKWSFSYDFTCFIVIVIFLFWLFFSMVVISRVLTVLSFEELLHVSDAA